MANNNSIPPKLYRNMLSDNYNQTKKDYQKIIEFQKRKNNPICQTENLYIPPKTKGNVLSQEYYKKMMEKPEKAHIKRIPIKSNLSSGLNVITEDNKITGKKIFNKRYHPCSVHKRKTGKGIIQENYRKFYFDGFSRLNKTSINISEKVSQNK